MADEWFRSSEWDVRAQEQFEERLRRASSSNRPQYLRIKALALMDHGGYAEARRRSRLVALLRGNELEA